MDDFSGSCMGQKFPLIHAAKEELKGYKVANLDAQSSNVNTAYGQAIGMSFKHFLIVFSMVHHFIRKQIIF